MKKILRFLAVAALLTGQGFAANTTISSLPAASTLTGAEIVPIVQSGATVQTTVGNFTQGMANATTVVKGLMSPTDKTTLTNATNAATASTLALRDGSGNIAFNNIVLASGTIAGTPSASTDIANKAYVDAAASGLTVKTAARLATTGNITLSAPQTIDGVSAIAGDRILVKDQVDATKNGIWVVAAGAWTRATDADTGAELVTNSYIFVTAGSVNFSTGWIMTTPNPITIGASNIVWALYSSLGSIPASSITGQIISSQIANLAITTAQFAANLTPVEIVGTLPTSGNFSGRTVFLTSNNKLYRYDGASFIVSVATTDLTGTINGTTQVTAGTITAASIQAGTITADKLVANSITAGQIQAGAISTTELAVGGVTGVKIANGTITSTQIAATTITADRLNVSSLSAISANIGSITSGTITSVLVQSTGTDGYIKMDATAGRFVATNGSARADLYAYNPGTGSLAIMTLAYGLVGQVALQASGTAGGSVVMKDTGGTTKIWLQAADGSIRGDVVTNNGSNGNYTIPLKVNGDNNLISFEYAGSNTLRVKIDSTVFTVALTP